MGLIRTLFAPFRRAAFLFFRAQLEVRVDGGVHVALNERPGQPVVSPAELAARRERSELEQLLAELGGVLSEAPEIRSELRHLAYLEYALQQKGLRALKLMPLDVLQKAHQQFEGLVTNWEPRGLATLRSKMSVTVRERQREADGPAAEIPVSEATEA
jgi:hypothetical protein